MLRGLWRCGEVRVVEADDIPLDQRIKWHLRRCLQRSVREPGDGTSPSRT